MHSTIKNINSFKKMFMKHPKQTWKKVTNMYENEMA